MTALDTGESTFYTTVSSENLDQIDAEVIFTQVDSEDALDAFLTSDRDEAHPGRRAGAVGAIVGEENVAAISPTALTLPWILPEIVDQLADGDGGRQGLTRAHDESPGRRPGLSCFRMPWAAASVAPCRRPRARSAHAPG